MEIKTKFNVGDEVWVLHRGAVANRTYRIVEQQGGETYGLFGCCSWFSQSDLFATKAEAEAERDRRNGVENDS